MKTLSIIGAALALAIPATAYAAAGCCAGMACCQDGADCCNDQQHAASHGHSGHDAPSAPSK